MVNLTPQQREPGLGASEGLARLSSRSLDQDHGWTQDSAPVWSHSAALRIGSQKKPMSQAQKDPSPELSPHLTVLWAELAVYHSSGPMLESPWGAFKRTMAGALAQAT